MVLGQKKKKDSLIRIALIQQHASPNRSENVERGIAAFKEAAKNNEVKAVNS